MKAYSPTTDALRQEPPYGTYAPRGIKGLLLMIAQNTPLHRGFARQFMARWIMGGAPVDTSFRGCAFRVRQAQNLIEYGLLLNPGYNTRELDFLIAGTPPGGVFVDLGSNVGLYTLPLAARTGPAGRVVAIDANPDMMPLLAFNLAASNLVNVLPVNVAVGDGDGHVSLGIHNDDLAIVSVRPDATGSIRMQSLLTILAENGIERVDTLKADIEGFEDMALAPFFAAAPEAMKPKRFVIEHLGRNLWKTDLFPIFEKEGYSLIGQTRGNSLFERRR
jgi:FkbM family methyltransferase